MKGYIYLIRASSIDLNVLFEKYYLLFLWSRRIHNSNIFTFWFVSMIGRKKI